MGTPLPVVKPLNSQRGGGSNPDLQLCDERE